MINDIDILKKPVDYINAVCMEGVKEILNRKNMEMTSDVRKAVRKEMKNYESDIKSMVDNFPYISQMEMDNICSKIEKSCDTVISNIMKENVDE